MVGSSALLGNCKLVEEVSRRSIYSDIELSTMEEAQVFSGSNSIRASVLPFLRLIISPLS